MLSRKSWEERYAESLDRRRRVFDTISGAVQRRPVLIPVCLVGGGLGLIIVLTLIARVAAPAHAAHAMAGLTLAQRAVLTLQVLVLGVGGLAVVLGLALGLLAMIDGAWRVVRPAVTCNDCAFFQRDYPDAATGRCISNPAEPAITQGDPTCEYFQRRGKG